MDDIRKLHCCVCMVVTTHPGHVDHMSNEDNSGVQGVVHQTAGSWMATRKRFGINCHFKPENGEFAIHASRDEIGSSTTVPEPTPHRAAHRYVTRRRKLVTRPESHFHEKLGAFCMYR